MPTCQPRRILCLAALIATQLVHSSAAAEPVKYEVRLETVSDGFDGEYCWFHPRAGAIPGPVPTVVLTMQKWWLRQSDVFLPVQSMTSTDLGKTWSHAVEHAATLGRHPEVDGIEEGICDFTPKWHAKTGKLFGTGQTVQYRDNKLVAVRPRASVWSVYDPKSETWTAWEALAMPDEAKFWNSGAGSTQRVDLADGTVLLPIYFKGHEVKAYATTVLRCTFDGSKLTYAAHGSELSVDIDRGLYEPSLAKFGGRFFLTMRNDRAAYVATSADGLHFDEPRKWTFDDGSDLGSYNTQAHWVTHSDGLFLTYTRKGANNDNVVRHRAPLFIAQVDPGKLTILRATERELVPNKGAQLGNFAVVDVSEKETWVTTSEGMAPRGSERFGANGRVYAARILWEKPNTEWNRH
jgi:hypothetical protein